MPRTAVEVLSCALPKAPLNGDLFSKRQTSSALVRRAISQRDGRLWGGGERRAGMTSDASCDESRTSRAQGRTANPIPLWPASKPLHQPPIAHASHPPRDTNVIG